ncbi:MAG TPA: TIGR02466 family protein [Sphingomonadaceae bacterium]|nr:TIGR02466 family protein [Sphingomonadaceae bacterium]
MPSPAWRRAHWLTTFAIVAICKLHRQVCRRYPRQTKALRSPANASESAATIFKAGNGRQMAGSEFTFSETKMLFPTPLLKFQISDAERINAALLDEIAERQGKEPGVLRSNYKGWHSELDFFARKEPAHVELSSAIASAVQVAMKRVAGKTAQLDRVHLQISGWINVNPTGAYNNPHDHSGAFWSGSYYVRNNQPKGKGDVAGAIAFIDCRSPPAGSALIKAPALQTGYTANPKAGELLIFPGTLKHWVHPNLSEEDRVSVAFNVFVLKGKAG